MNRVHGWLEQARRHAPLLVLGVALLLLWSPIVSMVVFALADATYVLYASVGIGSLRRETPRPREEAERRWKRFASRAGWLMDVACVSFVALSIVTHDTLPWPWPRWTAIALALVLGAIGLGTKAWAAMVIPRENYFWHDIFFPEKAGHFSRAGPYRWLANPMYTFGYAHTYGLGILTLSLPTLVGAAFAQSLILLFNAFVERPAGARRAQAVATAAPVALGRVPASARAPAEPA